MCLWTPIICGSCPDFHIVGSCPDFHPSRYGSCVDFHPSIHPARYVRYGSIGISSCYMHPRDERHLIIKRSTPQQRRLNLYTDSIARHSEMSRKLYNVDNRWVCPFCDFSGTKCKLVCTHMCRTPEAVAQVIVQRVHRASLHDTSAALRAPQPLQAQPRLATAQRATRRQRGCTEARAPRDRDYW